MNQNEDSHLQVDLLISVSFSFWSICPETRMMCVRFPSRNPRMILLITGCFSSSVFVEHLTGKQVAGLIPPTPCHQTHIWPCSLLGITAVNYVEHLTRIQKDVGLIFISNPIDDLVNHWEFQRLTL